MKHPLTDAVVAALRTKSPAIAQRFIDGFTAIDKRATTKTIMTDMNTYWRTHFTRLEGFTNSSTADIRDKLGDTSDHALWLADFIKVVVPAIIKLNLPLQGVSHGKPS